MSLYGYGQFGGTAVESYIRMLAEQGVTCLRLMLEYCQTGYRYFQRRDGSFNPLPVQRWTDLFDLCRACMD